MARSGPAKCLCIQVNHDRHEAQQPWLDLFLLQLTLEQALLKAIFLIISIILCAPLGVLLGTANARAGEVRDRALQRARNLIDLQYSDRESKIANAVNLAIPAIPLFEAWAAARLIFISKEAAALESGHLKIIRLGSAGILLLDGIARALYVLQDNEPTFFPLVDFAGLQRSQRRSC